MMGRTVRSVSSKLMRDVSQRHNHIVTQLIYNDVPKMLCVENVSLSVQRTCTVKKSPKSAA